MIALAWSSLRTAVAVGALALLAVWTARYGPLGPALPRLGSVAELGRSVPPGLGRIGLAATLVLLAFGLARRRLSELRTMAGPAWAFALAVIAVASTFELGHLVLHLAGALVLAAAVAVNLPAVAAGPRAVGWADRILPLALLAVVAATHATFSMHRHRWFGSGSWDLGCMVHNFHLASQGLGTVSSVLGGVDFLGDHFMPGIYLFAPLFWANGSAYMVLGVQAVSLAVTAPAVYAIARQRGVGPSSAASLALATGLGFGMQSAAYFDAHEITIGFGLLAVGIWAIETHRLAVATLALVLFSTFKESLGAYVVGLGLLLLVRGLRERRSVTVAYGSGWIVYGVLCFVVVNRVLKPMFAANGAPLVSHETFGDFGPTLFSALVGMLSDPLKAFGALLVPEEKALSIGVTLAGVGGLALLAPEVAIAALPLFAERFLSSKGSMWEMGYHYAAPLTLYAGWAAALGLPRARRAAAAWLDRVSPGQGRAAEALLAVYLVASGLWVAHHGYHHPANFLVWREPYFATPARRQANAAAVRFVAALGPSARVAAQNRILPHLADRKDIWRLGDHAHADVVVLSIGDSAWPYGDDFPLALARSLSSTTAWTLAFADGATAVFGRSALGLAPVQPTAELIALGVHAPAPARNVAEDP